MEQQNDHTDASEIRILYIEDEPVFCALLKRVVESHGYSVVVAHDGHQGISLFDELPYDIVIVDYLLPDQTGISVSEQLLQRQADLPIIMVTAHGDEKTAAAALAIGISHYLIKGATDVYLENIPTTIDSLVARRVHKKRQSEMEKVLQASEKKYRDLVNTAPICIYEINLEGQFTSANPAGRRVLEDVDVSDIIGTPYLDIPVAEDKGRVAELMTLARQGKGARFMFRAAGKFEIRQFNSSLEPILDSQGNVERIMGMLEDITERVRAEEEMAVKTTLLETVLNNMTDGIALFDKDHNMQVFNACFLDLMGLSKADVALGEPIDNSTADKLVRNQNRPDRHEDLVDELIESFSTSQPKHFEKVRADGSVISMKCASVPSGGFVATVSDNTELRKTEKTRNLLQSAVENLDPGVALFNAEGRLIFCNKSYTKDFLPELSGFLNTDFRVEEEAPIAPQNDLFDHIDRPYGTLDGHQAKQPIRSNRPFELETANGWMSYHEYKTSDGGTVVLNQDITERKLMESKLGHSQKMEAMGQLTGGIAHDFNNILAVIIGSLERLADDVDHTAANSKRVARAIRAAERGAALTQQLLSFAHKKVLNPKFTLAQDLIAGLMDLFESTLGEDIKVVTHIEAGTTGVNVDRDSFETAILNLAINSRDAMIGGGTLSLSTSMVSLEQGSLADVPDVNPGNYILIDVRDTGKGIGEIEAERVFEPFFTTKEVGKGSGLGLSMVYGFVRQSGGYISLSSKLGQGTSVKVYLPVSESQASEIFEGSTQVTPDFVGSKKILLVEDDPAVRGTTASILAGLGCEVFEAEDGRSALSRLDILTNSGIAIDLVFSDVVMPAGMSGYDLARQIKDKHDGLKILLTSGYPDLERVPGKDRDLFLSEVHFLPKPFRREKLKTTLNDLFNQ